MAGQLLSPRNRLVYTLWSPQRPRVGVRGAQLDPGNTAQPQLDAIEARLLHELQALFESPLLRNHVVADSFLHGRIIRQNGPAGDTGALRRAPVSQSQRRERAPLLAGAAHAAHATQPL